MTEEAVDAIVSLRRDALSAWHAGVAAGSADRAVAGWVDTEGIFASGAADVFVVATGKAAAAMARGLPRQAYGVALVPRNHPANDVPRGMEILTGDHPVPSREGIAASRRILVAVSGLGSGDRLLYLLSGGTSSLFEVPREGLDVSEVIEVYRLLLGSGAPIEAINTVRCALSAVKGGGLARAAFPAKVITLAVSDVAGDDPATIGSGPTVARPDHGKEACQLLERWGLWTRVPAGVRRWLEEAEPRRDEPFPPGRYAVIVSEKTAAEAAVRWLEERGYRVISSPFERLSGDAEQAALAIAPAIKAMVAERSRAAFVACGETTVTLPADAGCGGRNQHLAAVLARNIAGLDGFACMVGGTDGIDGSSLAAGALVDGTSEARARERGEVLARALACFETGRVFEASGDAVWTGPTGTNLGDLLVVTTAGRARSGRFCARNTE